MTEPTRKNEGRTSMQSSAFEVKKKLRHKCGNFFLTKDGAIKAMNVSGCLKYTELLYRLYDTFQPSLKPNQDADCNLARPLCCPVLLSRPQAGRVLEPADPSTYDQRHDGAYSELVQY